MKLFALENLPFSPVSHDPALRKQVMVGPGVLPGLRSFSHIAFPDGSRASEHVHHDGYEVFYCIRGRVFFTIDGEEVTLGKRQGMIVEPGETHSIEDTSGAELVYFFLMEGGPSQED